MVLITELPPVGTRQYWDAAFMLGNFTLPLIHDVPANALNDPTEHVQPSIPGLSRQPISFPNYFSTDTVHQANASVYFQ